MSDWKIKDSISIITEALNASPPTIWCTCGDGFTPGLTRLSTLSVHRYFHFEFAWVRTDLDAQSRLGNLRMAWAMALFLCTEYLTSEPKHSCSQLSTSICKPGTNRIPESLRLGGPRNIGASNSKANALAGDMEIHRFSKWHANPFRLAIQLIVRLRNQWPGAKPIRLSKPSWNLLREFELYKVSTDRIARAFWFYSMTVTQARQ